MTVAGRLEGTCVGRPVELEAQGQDLSLRVEDLWSAWSMRRNVSAATVPIVRTLGTHGFRLELRIGRRWKIELSPDPGFVIGLLFPGLRLSPA